MQESTSLSGAISSAPSAAGLPYVLVAGGCGAVELVDGRAASYVSQIRKDVMARGVVSDMRPIMGPMIGHPSRRPAKVFMTIIAPRIRGFCEGLPETGMFVSCANPDFAYQST